MSHGFLTIQYDLMANHQDNATNGRYDSADASSTTTDDSGTKDPDHGMSLNATPTETDDDSSIAADYDFFTTPSDIESRPEVRKYKLGNHSVRPSVDADELRASAEMVEGIDDELSSIFSQAAQKAEMADLNDFECQVCGLTHGHGDNKHDVRSGFNVDPEFAEMLEFNPACHCGVNELAMLVEFYDEIRAPVFTDEDDLSGHDLDDRFEAIRCAAEQASIAAPTENRINEVREALDAEFA